MAAATATDGHRVPLLRGPSAQITPAVPLPRYCSLGSPWRADGQDDAVELHHLDGRGPAPCRVLGGADPGPIRRTPRRLPAAAERPPLAESVARLRTPVRTPGRTCPRGARLHGRGGDRGGAQRPEGR